MSKLKAVLYGAKGTVSSIGVLSTITGHGLLHVVAANFRVKIPPYMIAKVVKYQADSADESFKKCLEEWKKED